MEWTLPFFIMYIQKSIVSPYDALLHTYAFKISLFLIKYTYKTLKKEVFIMKIPNSKFKTFLLWLLLTNLLYIASNYISSKIIPIENQYFLILYDIVITIGILYILCLCISKSIPLKKILQRYNKLFILIFVLLIALNTFIEKYVYNHLSLISYDTYQIVAKFLISNLQVSILYIILLLLAQKEHN